MDRRLPLPDLPPRGGDGWILVVAAAQELLATRSGVETGAPGHPPSLRGSWPLLTRLALGGVDLSPDPLTLLRRGLQGGQALPWTQGCRPVPACF